jgi:hypothetical protein
MRLLDAMRNFAAYGNEPHTVYLTHNPGRAYVPTPQSDVRHAVNNVFKHVSKHQAQVLRDALFAPGSCVSPCDCRIPLAHQVDGYPFNLTTNLYKTLWPGKFPPISLLLSEEAVINNSFVSI